MESLHSENKKYQCSYCSKALSSKQNLREHMFTHSGEKPYVCKEKGCGIRFRQGSQLSAHKRIHKAIHGKTQKVDFYDIKLTDILIKYPDFLGEKFKGSSTQPTCMRISVPLITNPQENTVLPSVFQ
ncbi:unnamed protein product [Blepharisma stoltei]|uniref:C2H2-type domain-containing protein n=1 Tax=Blepharisma stoltei TaxID=1481888 RepID=A0AAU9IXF2_9CILI|nr:unnamed protein product [Blepharisma stoltei]